MTEPHFSHFILSTSGRPSSLARYNNLLQKILGLDWQYRAYATKDPQQKILAADFVAELKKPGAHAAAISKDIKALVVPYLDILDPLSQKIGSVNTLLCKEGKLYGYNTDAYGFELAIKEGLRTSGKEIKNALIYGYGGVAGVAAYILKSLGFCVYLGGRNQTTIQKRASELLLEPYQLQKFDLLINAAPISDQTLDQAPGFLEALAKAKIVFDHHMPGLELQKYCQAHSIVYIPGTAMYYPQMYKQWALFLDTRVDQKDLPELIARAEAL